MKRYMIITVSLYLIACVSLISVFSADTPNKLKNAEANDVIFTIKNYWPNVDCAINALQQYGIEYIVLDAEGQKIGASKQDLKTDYRYDYIHKDYSVDIIKEDEICGRIIFINHEDDELRNRIGTWALLFFAIILLKDLLTVFYLKKHVFVPVKKMNMFARQIANGNLDIPVNRIASSYFGAFSESFDIMREELLYAKKKEREADKLRREMIASISHDIKNPVASIQAVAEYQGLTTDSDELRREFRIIVEKTNQINGLIANLHTSILNDLDRLEINPVASESSIIEKALRQADFKKKIGNFVILECLVMIDKIRIQQILDNIIVNSYKYADTEIEVLSHFEDDYLCISIKDFGSGVKKEEEIFLAQKYFRGQNAKEKEGSGLGIYISEYLIKNMEGKLRCYSEEGRWFEVKLWFLLAS